MRKVIVLALFACALFSFGQKEEGNQDRETTVKLDGIEAIIGGTNQDGGGELATDFETFSLGDINNQQGWIGQFANWTIESSNPNSGSQHFEGLSDGFGQSLAFSPDVGIGGDAKSSLVCDLFFDGSGVTWQIIPQSPTDAFVVTRIQVDPAGNLSALVDNGGGVFQPIPATLPTGYFTLGIEADRASAIFEVFINGTSVFTGQGFSGNVEQLVILSLMEVGGPIMDMDLVEIIDGPIVSCVIDSMQIVGNQLTITGNCPDGADIYVNGPAGLILVASGVVINGTVTITVPFYPDSYYFASVDGGATQVGGIMSNFTVPTLGEWGMIAFIFALLCAGVYFMKRRRLA
jgi:hypothetical protein